MNNRERRKEDKRGKLVGGNNWRNREIIKKRGNPRLELYIQGEGKVPGHLNNF